jgi:hypothetical protein
MREHDPGHWLEASKQRLTEAERGLAVVHCFVAYDAGPRLDTGYPPIIR